MYWKFDILKLENMPAPKELLTSTGKSAILHVPAAFISNFNISTLCHVNKLPLDS